MDLQSLKDLHLQIVYIATDNLKTDPNNARKHGETDVEAVKNSIEKFGMCDPIGIWGDDNLIVEGHGRLLALQKLGYTEAPCIRLDHLDPDARKMYALAHNKTAELSEWDNEKVAELLESLKNYEVSAEDFGFELTEFEQHFEAVEDDAPEVDEENEPTTKLGEVWKLGRHRLICGDSTDLATVEKLMNGKKADLFLTDPPYNVAYEGCTEEKLTIKNDNQSSRDFYQMLYDAFTNASAVTKAGGAAYVWHAHMESINFIASFQAAGFYLAQMLVWNKNTIALGRQDYQWKHEPCLYGWKEGAAHYFIDDRTQATVIEDKINVNKLSKAEMKELIKKLLEDKVSTSILNEDKPARNEEHPTMKPVKLLARQIRNSSKQGETVLDLFGGSGTTLIACEQLQRTCYMAELDPKYCDVIIKRWEKLTGQTAERVEQ